MRHRLCSSLLTEFFILRGQVSAINRPFFSVMQCGNVCSTIRFNSVAVGARYESIDHADRENRLWNGGALLTMGG